MSQNRFQPVDLSRAKAMNAAEAISYHYDNDTRFFSLWLDPTMSYSSARWSDPLRGAVAETLEAAQREKIRHHIDAVRVPAGGRLLDIGCGWGAVLAEAAQRGAAEAVGLTLSRDQAEHIRGQGAPGVTVLLQDVFDYRPDTTFHAAVSIGAFEHFARPHMDRAEKIATYRAFFERLHGMLTAGARFSLQTIVWDALTFDAAKRWIPETVFPQSDLPFIEEIAEGSNGVFRLLYVENNPDDYIRTLDAWIAALRAHHDTIVREWDATKYAFFEHYLRNSKLAFQRRKTSLARFVLQRR